MRPLHILLPIARLHLTFTPNDVPRYRKRAYLCHAADVAYMEGAMTFSESEALQNAIMARIRPHPTLCVFLMHAGVVKDTEMQPWDEAFVPYRDAYLDQWQTELERNFK